MKLEDIQIKITNPHRLILYFRDLHKRKILLYVLGRLYINPVKTGGLSKLYDWLTLTSHQL